MPRDKVDPEKAFPWERVQGDWRLTVVMSWSIIVTGWYCSVCCNRLQAWKSLENNLFKRDGAQIMVLFCLNQIGNRIPNPFSHSAMWLPHSIKAAHNLLQRRGPAWWHLFQGNGCTSDLCDLGEETFASWEVSTEAIPLGACVWEWSWHVVAGIRSIFENRWMGENASPSLLTLPSLHHSLLHSSSAWSHDKCLCTVSKERNGTGSPTLELHRCLIFVQVAYLCGNLALLPLFAPASDYLVLRTPC